MPKPAGKDPVRRVTLIVLALCVVVFAWYVAADRYTPYTDQARVDGLIVPIVPQVSGYLVESNVRLHTVVEEGEVLMRLDPRLYEMAVQAAEAELEGAMQQVGASAATVKAATARVGVARASLDRAQRNYDRVFGISEKNPGALSQADRDRADTSLASATERLASARADLERAQEQLGIEGPDNPRIRAAMAALEQAQLELAFTTLQAPTLGAIESYNIDVGHFAQAGQPLATFVSTDDVWIRADMRENNIACVKPGDRAEFSLDVAPGRIFAGEVASVGYGVSWQQHGSRGELVTAKADTGWLRDPQRFPVIVRFSAQELRGLLRVGGQADVVVYTGERTILNTIARWRLRIASWLSYVR